MTDEDTKWMLQLAVRDNILYGLYPYVPILVEDIPEYIKLRDYEQSCIKDVQTIGKIRAESTLRVFLCAVTPDRNVEFPISLKNICNYRIYPKRADQSIGTLWAYGRVFRIFGTLRCVVGEIVLDVNALIQVEDVDGSLQMIITLSKLVRREFHQADQERI